MSKVKIEIKLEENKEEKLNKKSNGILLNNKLKYICDNSVDIFDIEKLSLTRKTKEYEIILDFKNNNIKYKYNSNELILEIKSKIIKKEQEIIIEYTILDTNDKYKYRIIWR